MSDCYEKDASKESYYNEKSYILIAQNVAFNLSSAHGKDISAFSRVGGVPWQSVP